jgi:hypothetical protein
MKSITKPLLCIPLCWLLIAASCKKDKSPASELVTVNGQTFGCRVNGTPFIADKWDYGNNIAPVRIRFWYSPVLRKIDLQVIAEKQNNYVELWLNSPVVSGVKQLNTYTRPYPVYNNPLDYGLYQNISPNKEYITNNNIGGQVNILFVDTVNQRVEGTFEFTGTDRNTGEKVTVTNGYFKNF